MGVTQKAADAYTLFKRTKKIYTYGKLVKQSIDEDTRTGALMKLGIRAMLDLAGKAIGTSLTSHPYFTYHKAHLEALAQALNASSNLDKAEAALNSAIRSADASASLRKALDDYEHRKNGLKFTYTVFISGSLLLLRDRATDPEAAKDIRDAGQTPESLQATTGQNIYEWRANWCDLYLDSVGLLAMAEVELQATKAAMQKFDEKMKALATGGSIGTVAYYSMQERRQWDEYDRATQSGGGSVQAVEDPSGYAQSQVDAIEEASNNLGNGCDAAMSDDAYKPDIMVHRMHDL
ncbi:MAG TPA: hypothetical protein VGM18_06180 [Candidatus Sulfotelmatobacter sp.]|jgi:hypothetical protein